MNMPWEIKLSSGTAEALKWIALLAMTVDHINKYLFAARISNFFEFGRIAFPLFGLVLAYNIARLNAVEIIPRMFKRFLIFALIAQLVLIPLQGIWPLNIIFTLMHGVALVWLIKTQSSSGRFFGVILLFGVGGLLVEYFWFGLAYLYFSYRWCCSRNEFDYLLWIVSCASLYFVNGNHYAVAVAPLLFLASRVDIEIPRLRWLFYIYYPLHLGILLTITKL